MKNYSISTSFIIGLFALLFSCGKPSCVNYNSVFKNYSPEDLVYKRELMRLVENEHLELKFWLMGYEKKNEGEYLQIEAIGDSICAKAMILVKDWSKMEGIRKTEGGAYHGAGLIGLQFILNPISEDLEYLDVEEIIDYD